jgi:hypothetical protein
MLYYAHFDEETQTMSIEDDMGNKIIEERAHSTIIPYRGRQWTFEQEVNKKQWARIFDLVYKANTGRTILDNF